MRMESTATDPLWERIEAALARIETAIEAAPAREPASDERLDDLTRRHALLRDAATTSLTMIDALIAGHDSNGRR